MRITLPLVVLLAVACQDDAPAGAKAGDGVVNAECGSTSDCGSDLRCHRETCIAEAHPIGDAGDACSVNPHCMVPLVCIGGSCDNAPIGGNEPTAVDNPGPWIPPTACDLEYPYGFVSLITGPTAVVDLCSCNKDGEGRLERLSEIGQGHFITHGVGIDRRRGEMWYGNQGTNSVQRLGLAKDLLSYEIMAEISIPAGLSTIHRSPNGRYVATGASEPQMVPEQIDEFAKNRATFIDTGLNKIVGIVQSESPGAVFFSSDSTRAWIPDINHRQFVEVLIKDLALPETPINRVIKLPWPEDKLDLIGPAPFLDQSLDYRWIAIPGLDAEKVFVYDTEADQGGDNWEAAWEYDTPGERPHQVAWTPDAKRLWLTTFTRWPSSGSESQNPSIPSYVHVIDAETHERVARFQWSPDGRNTAVWHVEITPDGGHAWVSGSYGSIVGFNLDTFEPECAVSLNSGPRPAMTLDY